MLHRPAAAALALAFLVAFLVGAGLFLGGALEPAVSQAAEASTADLEYQFNDKIQPILIANCFTCHANGKHEGDLDLSTFGTMGDVIKGYDRFETVRERLEAKEMPPPKAKQQPTPEERQLVIDWIATVRQQVAKESAGDPGPVLARRLSNAE